MDRSPSYTVELKEIPLLLSENLYRKHIFILILVFTTQLNNIYLFLMDFLKKQISLQLKYSKEQDKNKHIKCRWKKKAQQHDMLKKYRNAETRFAAPE